MHSPRLSARLTRPPRTSKRHAWTPAMTVSKQVRSQNNINVQKKHRSFQMILLTLPSLFPSFPTQETSLSKPSSQRYLFFFPVAGPPALMLGSHSLSGQPLVCRSRSARCTGVPPHFNPSAMHTSFRTSPPSSTSSSTPSTSSGRLPVCLHISTSAAPLPPPPASAFLSGIPSAPPASAWRACCISVYAWPA